MRILKFGADEKIIKIAVASVVAVVVVAAVIAVTVVIVVIIFIIVSGSLSQSYCYGLGFGLVWAFPCFGVSVSGDNREPKLPGCHVRLEVLLQG